jgi:hypothetical protein
VNLRAVVTPATTLGLMLAAAGVTAAELRLETSVGSYGELNDNPRLLPEAGDGVVGLVVNGNARLTWAQEDWTCGLSPGFVNRSYTDGEGLDALDARVDADLSRRFETSEISAAASYAREHALTSEVAATGVVIDTNTPRYQGALSFGGSRTIVDRVVAGGRLAYETVTFENGRRYGLLDYDYVSAAGFTRYAVSPRSSFSVIGRLARLDVPQTGGWSNEVSIGLGVDHAWNERWQARVAVGPSRSEYRFGPAVSGYSYRAGLQGGWQRASVDLSAERVLSPTAGQGRLQVRDSLRLASTYRLRLETEASAFVAADRYEDTGELLAGARDDSGSVRAGVALDWRPSRSWSWRVSYLHNYVRYAGFDEQREQARGNQLLVGVTWQGPSRSTSL